MTTETTTTTLCSECWNEHPKSDLVNIDGKLICGACKERHLQRLHEGVPSTKELEYAGFWVRVAAKLLDGLIFCGSLFAIILIISGVSGISFRSMSTPEGIQSLQSLSLIINLSQLIFGVVLPVFFIGRFAATPGKMILGLKIIRSDGERVTYLRAFCRMLSEIISGMILYIGYIMVAFTDGKKGLHDIICDTRVIRK
ncbi:MAG: RDD family protein [Candidatus Brocadiaceae bacterium]|nr:RDD family protein [Candidatus Brocadiaceae bacterium]